MRVCRSATAVPQWKYFFFLFFFSADAESVQQATAGSCQLPALPGDRSQRHTGAIACTVMLVIIMKVTYVNTLYILLHFL